MDVVLQIGAPLCAHATFHAYMEQNRDLLARHGIGFWGPARLRALVTGPRAAGRVALALEMAERAGLRQVLVSAPGLGGSARGDLRAGALGSGAGRGLAALLPLFGARVTRVALSVRSPDRYWASALARRVALGGGLPDRDLLRRLVAAAGWRDAVSQVAQVTRGAELVVLPHEAFAGLPERRLWHLGGRALLPPMTHARDWLNPAPGLPALRQALAERGADPGELAGEGRWMPFDAPARAALRESYSDDLLWLAAGAEGLAWLVRERDMQPGEAEAHPPAGETRGRQNDIEEGRMVRHR